MKLIVDKEAKEKAGFDCSAASASPSLPTQGMSIQYESYSSNDEGHWVGIADPKMLSLLVLSEICTFKAFC